MSEIKLNLKEIIEIAIQIEISGAAFYKRLKELTEVKELKELYSDLEKAEYVHIKDFENILESALRKHPDREYPTTEQGLLYLRAFASRRIFKDPAEATFRAEQLNDPLEGIEMAIDFELNSVSFYREMAEVIQDPEDKGSVQELERQEREHAAQLLEIQQKMTGDR